MISASWKPNGGRYHKVVEPLTAAREVAVRWEKTPVNLAKLATLRGQGRTTREIAEAVGVSPTTAKKYLRQIRDKAGSDTPSK